MVDITIFTMENHHFFHGLMNGGSIELVFMGFILNQRNHITFGDTVCEVPDRDFLAIMACTIHFIYHPVLNGLDLKHIVCTSSRIDWPQGKRETLIPDLCQNSRQYLVVLRWVWMGKPKPRSHAGHNGGPGVELHHPHSRFATDFHYRRPVK
jgi:hypothetical protein